MTPLDLVNLTALMERTGGSPDVTIGLIDGPVLSQHPDLASGRHREAHDANSAAFSDGNSAAISGTNSAAVLHGTFVAGILTARRGSVAPAICPDCTLLSRPIFAEAGTPYGEVPSATPEKLARAILDCLDGGARVLNISAAIARCAIRSERALDDALGRAAARGVLVIVAAGNQGTLGSTALTRHPWVVPVVGYDLQGKPMNHSNLGSSIGRQGLGAPGENITSLGAGNNPLTLSGTSAAAPFVTGAVALLWSEFPATSAADMRLALTQPDPRRRRTVVPPLLDAWTSYRSLAGTYASRR
jgi:subtilisin family serine protease